MSVRAAACIGLFAALQPHQACIVIQIGMYGPTLALGQSCERQHSNLPAKTSLFRHDLEIEYAGSIYLYSARAVTWQSLTLEYPRLFKSHFHDVSAKQSCTHPFLIPSSSHEASYSHEHKLNRLLHADPAAALPQDAKLPPVTLQPGWTIQCPGMHWAQCMEGKRGKGSSSSLSVTLAGQLRQQQVTSAAADKHHLPEL